MKIVAGALFCACLVYSLSAVASSQDNGQRYALVIGISDYDSSDISRLEGPAHDLVAVTNTLVGQWKFEPSNIITLMNEDATFDRILKELSWLKATLRRGDYLFFYFSGHGTSAYDPLNLWPMPFGTGALVPVDAKVTSQGMLDSVIFSRRHIRPVFESLDHREITVLAIFDTCYSEHAVRQLAGGSYKVVGNRLPVPSQMGKTSPEISAHSQAYPYQNIYTISAAGENQLALDLDYKVLERYPTVDGMPHGALTDSLLRTLQSKLQADLNSDGSISHFELYSTTRSHMQERGLAQDPKAYPQSEHTSSHILQWPLFQTGLP